MLKMKAAAAAILLVLVSSCGNSDEYGQKFENGTAVAVSDAYRLFVEQGQTEFVVTGKISNVCQSEGCWFHYATDSGELYVDFAHKFEIPMNSAGKTAIAKGYFSRDTTSVEQLKEWARDEKKSRAEIDSITKPEVQIIFNASGVKLSDK